MLPKVPATSIQLTLAGHTFTFRRLSWRDEVKFSLGTAHPTRLDYCAWAMDSVDSKPIGYSDALTLLQRLPKPIQDRVVVFYLGSLPARRSFTLVGNLYTAPDPAPYVERVAIEPDTEDSGEREVLRRFGREEVDEAEAQAEAMARASNYAGATAPSSISVPDSPHHPGPTPSSISVPDHAPSSISVPDHAPSSISVHPGSEVGEEPVVYHFEVD